MLDQLMGACDLIQRDYLGDVESLPARLSLPPAKSRLWWSKLWHQAVWTWCSNNAGYGLAGLTDVQILRMVNTNMLGSFLEMFRSLLPDKGVGSPGRIRTSNISVNSRMA